MKTDILVFLKTWKKVKSLKKIWDVCGVCINCGYVHEGDEAPKACPACVHPQSYFELLAENW